MSNPYQQELDWHGLYPANSSRDDVLFTDESTQHPAKMSLPITHRILRQMQEWGWLKTGDVVTDPFGGRGTTPLVWCGLHPKNRAVTVELESHFVEMQRRCKEHAEGRLGREVRWTILQGDSRKADELLAGVVGLTSPPYDGDVSQSRCDPHPERMQGSRQMRSYRDTACLTSPPYEGSLASDDPEKRGGLFKDPKRANDRTLTGTYAGVTSPPYEAQRSEPNYSPERIAKMTGPIAERRHAHKGSRTNGYSAVTSPPYEAQSGGVSAKEGHFTDALIARHGASNSNGARGTGYGENLEGQIGATQGEAYQDACLEVYRAMARAGVRYLAVVTKNPTRNGKLRRLDKVTARLLRQAGYRVVAWRRAWLWMPQAQAEERVGQACLFEDLERPQRPVGRLSFFKRLHLARGSMAAQWEDVLFAVLPEEPEAAPTPAPAPERKPLPRDTWLPSASPATTLRKGGECRFLGQDGQRLGATVEKESPLRVRVHTVGDRALKQAYPVDFARGEWPAGLEAVG